MLSIEKNIPLSQSRLWDAQRDFFNKEGINAWQGQVPFFVTSNPFIAKTYAKLISAYLKDLQASQQIDPTEPIYIFELGTGSGQFSFYCLKALKEELFNGGWCGLGDPEQNMHFCYVLTDFTESNIEFWEQQKLFSQFGHYIDFAQFDFEQPGPIYLRKQNKTLTKLKNPCILIGNYIFDSVRQDYYAMEYATLTEKRIETFLAVDDYDLKTATILSLKSVKIEERPRPYTFAEEARETPYLRYYETHLQKGLFSLPMGGFDALDFFHAFAPQGMMLISSDKGYNTLSEIEARKKLELVMHGSFSLDVNFHALALYFEFLGGQSLLQSYRDGIKTNVFLSHNYTSPQLSKAFQEMTDGMSPADYFLYHRRFRDETKLHIDLILSQLYLSGYDPYVLSLAIDKLCEALRNKNTDVLVEAYKDIIPKLYEQIYPLPQATDHYFNLGMLLHTLTEYQAAVPYYQESLAYYGPRFATLYNLGICEHMTGNYSKAKALFEQAIPLEENGEKKAEHWLAETNQYANLSSPDPYARRTHQA